MFELYVEQVRILENMDLAGSIDKLNPNSSSAGLS